MVCQDHLLKSIQAIHKAAITYSNCIAYKEAHDPQEEEIFQKFGLELTTQLAVLRKMYLDKFGIDPITGHPQEILNPCNCNQEH